MPKQAAERRRQRRYDPLSVLSYIHDYQRQHAGRSPSQRQIQRELSISAPSVVHMIERRLARDGLLTITTYGRGLPADLTITADGLRAVQQWRAEQPSAAAEPA